MTTANYQEQERRALEYMRRIDRELTRAGAKRIGPDEWEATPNQLQRALKRVRAQERKAGGA